jgi:predicted transposase YdaD
LRKIRQSLRWDFGKASAKSGLHNARMKKHYDITLKHLLGDFASDWIRWLGPMIGLPATAQMDAVDVDLSTVQLAADKAFRLRPPFEGIVHIEPQTTHDGELPHRIMLYNAHLYRAYQVPVYSVALLLRPEANAAAITGNISRNYPDGREYLRFRYMVIRVWELNAESLLHGPTGMMPLCLLTDDARDRLPDLVKQADEELRSRDIRDADRKLVLTSAYILMGLRYDDDVIDGAFLGVQHMEESTTYQKILRTGRQQGLQEGRQEGRQEGLLAARQDDLLAILQDRFGKVSKALKSRIQKCTDTDKLRAALLQTTHIERASDLEI